MAAISLFAMALLLSPPIGHGPDMAMEVASGGTTDLDHFVMFLLDATRPASVTAKLE